MERNYAVSLHFDGDIARDHQLSMRTLGKTLSHLQNAVDRACLEINYGALWKHTRMPQRLWPEAELIIGPSFEGGYILDFFLRNQSTREVLERVKSAIKSAFEKMTEEGVERTRTIAEQVTQNREQIRSDLVKPISYKELVHTNDPKTIRTYGDRAIVREIDMILSIIRSSAAGESSFELTLAVERPMKYSFTKSTAVAFHEAVSKREMGLPVIYTAKIRSLDRISKSAKIIHTDFDRQANLFFATEETLLELIPFFEENEEIVFYGAPWIEYGAFDPTSGDILFIAMPSSLR